MAANTDETFMCSNELIVNESLDLTNITCQNGVVKRMTSLSPLLETNSTLATIYITLVSAIMFSGVFGNIMILLVAGWARGLNKVGKEFMVNIAVADLCVTAIAEPMCILGVVKGEAFFQDKPWLCNLVASKCLTACFCAFMSLTMLSVNRFIYLCHNSVYYTFFGKKSNIVFCVMCWVLAFLCELPNFFGWGGHYFDKKNHQCIWDRTSSMSYSYVVAFGLILFPLLVMKLCFILIFRHIWKTKKNLYDINAKSMQICINETVRASATNFAIFVIFVICWTPYATLLIIDINDELSIEIHLFITILAHLHSSCNFFIYFLSNKRFRKVMFRILGCGDSFQLELDTKHSIPSFISVAMECDDITCVKSQAFSEPDQNHYKDQTEHM